MKKSIFRFAASAFGASALLTAAATAQEDTPKDGAPMTIAAATSGPSQVALWKTGDADTIVYLFGTVHILQPTIEWQHSAFEAAWQASDTAYFEADVLSPEVAAEIGPLMLSAGYDAEGKTLTSYYTPEEIEKIDAALASYGMRLSNFGSMRPWFASINLAQAAIQKTGGRVDAGIEIILETRAGEEDKSVRYFETAAQQIGLLSGLDDKDQAAALLQSIDELADPEQFFAELIGAWYRGDADGLAALMTETGSTYEEFNEVLLYRRNAAWAETLDQLIKDEPGTFFIAVGAGHLAGPRSVQDYLSEKGHDTVRVPVE